MKLHTVCEKCEADITFNTWVEDRVALKMEKGEEIELTCKKCKHTQKYQINSIFARKSRLQDILAGSMFLFGAAIIYVFKGYLLELSNKQRIVALLAITLVIYFIYKKIKSSNVKRVNLFNES